MKIFSSQFSKIDDTIYAKSVILQKSGQNFSVLRHYNTDAENIQSLSRGKRVLIAADYLDTVSESIQMPPVKDSKTFRIIAMNKLKDKIDTTVDYLLGYKEDTISAPAPSGMTNYNVFLIPRRIFNLCAQIPNNEFNIGFFTVSDYALCALTKRYFPGEIVFHAYADESKITVSVCCDSMVLYTRSSQLQKSTDYAGLYYEYLNLTYMYAVKNLKLDIAKIVFSGDMANIEGLSNTFYEFSGKPISTLAPFGLIQNCSHDIFQKYIIPISLCFLDEEYDLTPVDIKEKQGKNALTILANAAALLIIIILAMLNLSSFMRMQTAEDVLASQKQKLHDRIEQYSKEVSDLKTKKFGLYYYQTMKKHQIEPINSFQDFDRIISLRKYDNVVFESTEDGKNSVTISGDLKFRTLSGMENFRDRFSSAVSKIESTGKYDITDTSQATPNELKMGVMITFITKKPVTGAASE